MFHSSTFFFFSHVGIIEDNPSLSITAIQIQPNLTDNGIPLKKKIQDPYQVDFDLQKGTLCLLLDLDRQKSLLG